MEWLKEAMEYVVGMKKPEIIEACGHTYSDKALVMLDEEKENYASYIELSTLSSLIDYIGSCVDAMKGKQIIHVVSPTAVDMFSVLDKNRKRENLIRVRAVVPEYSFGYFLDKETFTIAVQSKFLPTEDRDIILRFSGTVEKGTVTSYGDDGVSQKATVKTGISSKSDALIPNPVTLKPYRTFIEVDQPESDFVFRMKDSGDVKCALFEADGGAWKNEAMENVADYIRDGLERIGKDEDFIVIY